MTTKPIVALPADPSASGVNFQDIAANVAAVGVSFENETYDANKALFPQQPPSVMESIGEAARQFNTETNIYEAIRKALRENPDVDPEFNPFEYAKANLERPEFRRALPEMFDRLHALNSKDAFDRVIEDVNLELNDTEKMMANGILPMLAGGVIGSVASPSTWIAGAGTAKVLQAARLFQGAGRGAAAGRFGAVAVGETIPLDIASRAAMDTYDMMDSLENFGFSAAGGALIGRFLGVHNPSSPFRENGPGWKSLDNPGERVNLAPDGDLSAARALRDTPEDTARLVPFDQFTPVGRAVRRGVEGNDVDFSTHAGLYEMNVETKGNAEGMASRASAEIIANTMFDARFFSSQQEITDIYRSLMLDVYGEGAFKGTIKDMIGSTSNRISKQQFDELVEDYRRALMAVEDGAQAPVPEPHGDPRVAQAIKQAAERRDAYYAKYLKDLVDTTMLRKDFVVQVDGKAPKSFETREAAEEFIAARKAKEPEFQASILEVVPEARKHYTPIILNRRAIDANLEQFKAFLRDSLKANPPAEFLMERFGKASLKDLDATERELAIADWVNYQKGSFEKSAEAAYKKATKELGHTLQEYLRVRKELKGIDRRTAKTELERARLVERELNAEWDAKNLAREDAKKELQAIKTARDLAEARRKAREATAPKSGPDVGERELDRLNKALKAQDAKQTKASNTTLDALTDVLTPEGRAKDAGDVAKAQAAAEKNSMSVFDSKVAAKVDPLEAPKAPKPDFDNARIGQLEERLKQANARLTQLDREIEDVVERLSDIRSKRSKAEASLEHLNSLKRDAVKNATIIRRELAKTTSSAKRATERLNRAYEGKYKTIEEQIEEVINNLRNGSVPKAVLQDIVPESGRVKERELFVGDMLLDPRLKTFIETNGERLAELYGRDMSARVAFRKSFGNDVSDDLRQPLNDLKAFWNDKIDKATGKEKERLIAQRDESVKDFEGVRDRLLGRLGRPEDPDGALPWLGRNLRRFNVARLMGLSLLSNLTDLASATFATGKTFAYLPLMGKNMAKMLEKIPDNETRALILGSEQARLHDLANRQLAPETSYWESYGGFGHGNTRIVTQAIDRGMDIASRGTMVLSGTAWFTSKVRSMVSVVQMDNMARELPMYSSLTDKQKKTWARLGIDETMANRISNQLSKHGDDIDGVRVPNMGEWTDGEAAAAYRHALRRVQETGSIQPGAGDLPLFMSSEMGKLLFQFMGYSFAATNRYVRLAWQARDVNAIMSLHLMLGLATVGYVARETVKGTNDKGETTLDRLEKNKPADWMYEAINRSALPGVWSYGVDAARKMFQAPVQEALGVEVFGNNPSRMAARGAFSGLLGPSFGLLENIGTFGNAVASAPTEGWDKAANAAQRIAPFANLLPMLMLHSASEEAFR